MLLLILLLTFLLLSCGCWIDEDEVDKSEADDGDVTVRMV